MNTRKIAAEYRLSHWAQIIQNRKTSGMSVTEYCKTENFHPNIYYYWQRKLREATCRELSIQTKNADIEKKNTLVPKGWAICETVKETNPEKILPIEINGCRVLVENDTDIDLIKKVCRILVTL